MDALQCRKTRDPDAREAQESAVRVNSNTNAPKSRNQIRPSIHVGPFSRCQTLSTPPSPHTHTLPPPLLLLRCPFSSACVCQEAPSVLWLLRQRQGVPASDTAQAYILFSSSVRLYFSISRASKVPTRRWPAFHSHHSARCISSSQRSHHTHLISYSS